MARDAQNIGPNRMTVTLGTDTEPSVFTANVALTALLEENEIWPQDSGAPVGIGVTGHVARGTIELMESDRARMALALGDDGGGSGKIPLPAVGTVRTGRRMRLTPFEESGNDRTWDFTKAEFRNLRFNSNGQGQRILQYDWVALGDSANNYDIGGLGVGGGA